MKAYRPGAKSGENEIRSITVDHESNVWAATAEGIYMKKPGTPAFCYDQISSSQDQAVYLSETQRRKSVAG